MSASSQSHRREQAVALQYTELDALPKIIASGAGEIARQIISIAEQHGIPIQEDSSLTEMLSALKVGNSITQESYRLVAEIISFLYHTDLNFRAKHEELAPVLDRKVPASSKDADQELAELE